MFFLLLEIGLVLALYIVGSTPLGMGLFAVLLLSCAIIWVRESSAGWSTG